MTARYDDLKDKAVFISGGATGIGADLVAGFHGQGARVVFCDIDVAEGEALAGRLAASGAPAPVFVAADVTDDAALIAAIGRAEAWGGLDVLVNNAANDRRGPISETEADLWRRMVDINLRHKYVAAREAARLMTPRRRGVIINFGSVAPEVTVPDLSVYNMCKAGVRGLTRSFARDLGPHGIRVVSILPGAILTPKQRKLWYADQAAIDAVVAEQMMPVELNGGHVAAMALFLASDVAAGCTGQNYIVDAGLI